MTEVIFRPVGTVADEEIMFSVICARYRDKWVFSRHRERDTWEIPGGHREAGETPLETARRELYEETGAVRADFTPVCVYGVKRDTGMRFGMLYFAVITEMGDIPASSEIAEITLSDALPRRLTYPAIQPHLYREVQGYLNRRTAADEMWDVYDENRQLTGRFHRRGDHLVPGEYHLSVFVWVVNDAGEILITRRAPNKGYPLIWEITGGSAVAGDDSLTAALREVREETGLTLDPAKGRIALPLSGKDWFGDVWVFRQEISMDDIRLQEGETCEARLVTRDELLALRENDLFIPCSYMDELLTLLFRQDS